jgi:anti-sigma factor ChrR (cupin superfamily)
MTSISTGYEVVRFGDVPWERRTEDNWPPLVKRMHKDQDLDLSMNIVWYGRGVVEPRHVHDATHATWILVGSAEMDGQRIGPGDLVFGPGHLPHGPLTYEMGCLLFGSLLGSTIHTAVGEDHRGPVAEGIAPHLATSTDKEWGAPEPSAGDSDSSWACQTKVVVRDTDRQYVASLLRWPAGSTIPGHAHAGSHVGLVVAGRAVVDGHTLGPWDLLYAPGGISHGGIDFPEDCTMIFNTFGDQAPVTT